MIGTGCSSLLAAAQCQQPSRYLHRPGQPALRSLGEEGTSPLKTRVLGFRQPPSGHFSRRRRRNHGIATGSSRCAYKTASGLPQWLNRDPIQEYGGINLHTFVGNVPFSFVDPWGLKIKYEDSDAGAAAKNEIECWKNGLPSDSPLRKLISDLENDKNTVTIKSLNGVKLANGKPATLPQTEPTALGNSIISINPVGYWYDNDKSKKENWYTYLEALVHELLHAHDQIVSEKNRHHEPEFFEEEKPLRSEAKKPCKCP